MPRRPPSRRQHNGIDASRIEVPHLVTLIDRDLLPFPGAVAVVRVQMHATYEFGKRRPAVLLSVDEYGEWWTVSCLTTSRLYSGGEPRTPAAGGHLVGLPENYVWGGSHRAHRNDIDGIIWAAPAELLEACVVENSIVHAAAARCLVDSLVAANDAACWTWPRPEYADDDEEVIAPT